LAVFIYLPYKADISVKMGMELYKQGKIVESGNELRQAIALDPERGDARLVLGIILAMMNDFNASAAQLVRSQNSYDDVTLHYYLGRVYEALKNESGAKKEYLQALSYFPEGTDVRNAVKDRLTQLEARLR
jgi:tetratricopeptide (TPR) repeat protein